MGDIVICRIHIRGGIHVEGTALNDKTGLSPLPISVAFISNNIVCALECEVTTIDGNLALIVSLARELLAAECITLGSIKCSSIDYDLGVILTRLNISERTTFTEGKLTTINGNKGVINSIEAKAISSVVDNTVLNNNFAAIGHNNIIIGLKQAGLQNGIARVVEHRTSLDHMVTRFVLIIIGSNLLSADNVYSNTIIVKAETADLAIENIAVQIQSRLNIAHCVRSTRKGNLTGGSIDLILHDVSAEENVIAIVKIANSSFQLIQRIDQFCICRQDSIIHDVDGAGVLERQSQDTGIGIVDSRFTVCIRSSGQERTAMINLNAGKTCGILNCYSNRRYR